MDVAYNFVMGTQRAMRAEARTALFEDRRRLIVYVLLVFLLLVWFGWIDEIVAFVLRFFEIFGLK